MHRIGIYDDYTDPDIQADTMRVGDGMYYDGGLYGPDGGPDQPDLRRGGLTPLRSACAKPGGAGDQTPLVSGL